MRIAQLSPGHRTSQGFPGVDSEPGGLPPGLAVGNLLIDLARARNQLTSLIGNERVGVPHLLAGGAVSVPFFSPGFCCQKGMAPKLGFWTEGQLFPMLSAWLMFSLVALSTRW